MRMKPEDLCASILAEAREGRDCMALEEFDDRAARLSTKLLNLPAALFNSQRVAILLQLYGTGGVDFAQLKRDLSLSDGALATHLKVMVAEGFVETSKEVVGSRERTGYLITARGIQALESLVEDFKELGEVIKYE